MLGLFSDLMKFTVVNESLSIYNMYKAMYLTSCVPPSSMDYPISSMGSVTCGVAKVLAKVLKPLGGKSPTIYKVPRTL